MSGISRGIEQAPPIADTGLAALSPSALFELLSSVCRQADRYLDGVLPEFGIQRWEYDVITTLLQDGEPYEMCPGTIGGHLGVSNSAMTNRIDRLERAGLVERHLSPHNRRIVIIRLSEAGRALAGRALMAHCEAAKRVVEQFPVADVSALTGLLEELGAALSEAGDS